MAFPLPFLPLLGLLYWVFDSPGPVTNLTPVSTGICLMEPCGHCHQAQQYAQHVWGGAAISL